MAALKPWIDGWQEAAFGPDGFYRKQHPYDHFATSVSQDALAPALLPYLVSALDHLDSVTVVDVGAGDGDLGVQLHDLLDENLRLRVHFWPWILDSDPSICRSSSNGAKVTPAKRSPQSLPET